MKSVFKIEELGGEAYNTAVVQTRKALRKVYHIAVSDLHTLEKLASEHNFIFTANGDLI